MGTRHKRRMKRLATEAHPGSATAERQSDQASPTAVSRTRTTPALTPTINIAGLNTADVLAALYNNAKIQGRGILHPGGSVTMTRRQAAQILTKTQRFDYLAGRVLKVDLDYDDFEFWLYDRDNGEGKAARVIDHLRKTGSIEEII